jgi:hypothetical protein
MKADDRFGASHVGNDVLLLFTEGASDNPINVGGGIIPPHDTEGSGQFCFRNLCRHAARMARAAKRTRSQD